MLLSQDTDRGDYIIQRYEPGKIVVNDKTYTQSLIISAKQLIDDWQPQSISQLENTHLDAILEMSPEIVLLGTGKLLQFPEPSLLAIFASRNIGVEVMDTGAACRTFRVLVAEGRKAAAALLID